MPRRRIPFFAGKRVANKSRLTRIKGPMIQDDIRI
jgi:hypothetical protein